MPYIDQVLGQVHTGEEVVDPDQVEGAAAREVEYVPVQKDHGNTCFGQSGCDMDILTLAIGWGLKGGKEHPVYLAFLVITAEPLNLARVIARLRSITP